jgi:hypothetical protein
MATIRRIAKLRLRHELVDATDGLRLRAEAWTDIVDHPFPRFRAKGDGIRGTL